MGRHTGPRAKICRRLGFQIFGNDNVQKAFLRREQDGFRRRQSEYGRRLVEKQKVMFYYGTRERQMRNLFGVARRAKGDTGKSFLTLLERRLDNAVYSAGFACSRAQARQLVAHGNIYVDGRRVDIASFRVSPGHTITICPKPGPQKLVKEILSRRSGYEPPDWIAVDAKSMTAKIVRLPVREDVRLPVNEQLVVEFYSR